MALATAVFAWWSEKHLGKNKSKHRSYLHTSVYAREREISMSMCSAYLLHYSVKIPAAGTTNALGRVGKTRITALSVLYQNHSKLNIHENVSENYYWV